MSVRARKPGDERGSELRGRKEEKARSSRARADAQIPVYTGEVFQSCKPCVSTIARSFFTMYFSRRTGMNHADESSAWESLYRMADGTGLYKASFIQDKLCAFLRLDAP